MGYNFFNWTTRNMNQKFSYFPRPSIRATPIHSRHFYFPPVSTFGLPEHEFSYSLKAQCILNLATYFIFPWHRPFFYDSLCKLTCKIILFIFGRAISQRLMPGLCSRTVLNRKQSGNGNCRRTTANCFQNIVPDHTLFLDIYCLFLSNVLLLW